MGDKVNFDNISFSDLCKTVSVLSSKVCTLENQVNELSNTVVEQQKLITQLSADSDLIVPTLSESILEKIGDETDTFKEFLVCDKRAKQRIIKQKQEEKLHALKEVFCTMKELDNIGKRNEKIFGSINIYFEILKEIKPSEEQWTWMQWWNSTTSVSITRLQKEVNDRINLTKALLDGCSSLSSDNIEKQLKAKNELNNKISYLQVIGEVIDEIMEEQKKHAETAYSWNIYTSNAEPDVNQIKDKLSYKLDKSGFALCKKLENSIKELDDNPAQFIEDHYPALLNSSSINEQDHERVKEFAEHFALTEDWVLVDDVEDEKEDDLNWLTWSLRNVRNSCSIYGYHTSVDQMIDTAGEYKSTCNHIKTTIEWVYFGGRLAVDPTGAVLSLLW